MAAFSVPLSSLCVSTMTGMVLAPPAQPADAVVQVPPQVADQSLVADVPPTFLRGFRVEGAPELDLVFGDSEHFKRHIDRFFALDKAMDQTRSAFSHNVQAALETLGDHPRGRCPVDQVAAAFYEARRDGETYRALGAEMEGEAVLIRQLDDLGETAGLTPDYRWRVRQAHELYKHALVDLREMRVEFMTQLGSELAHRGCSRHQLLARGAELAAEKPTQVAGNRGPGAPDSGEAGGAAGHPGEAADSSAGGEVAAPATVITFYVDNQACTQTQSVFLDGALIGQVNGRSRSAFQASEGHHALCLIEASASARCGDPGTLRTAFLHDGWSIALHCRPGNRG